MRFKEHCGCEVLTEFGWGYCEECDKKKDVLSEQDAKLGDKE